MFTQFFRKASLALAALALLAGLFLPAVQPVQARSAKLGYIHSSSTLEEGQFDYLFYKGMDDFVADSSGGAVLQTYLMPAGEYTYEEQVTLLTGLVNDCVSDGNDVCAGANYMLGDIMLAAAQSNPGVRFIVGDYSYDTSSGSFPANLQGQTYRVEEAAYLAGVLAAKMSSTHAVGEIGGLDIPPVAAFMDGFRNGAHCTYKNTRMLSTYYTGDGNAFNDPAWGAAKAEEYINTYNADVILPPAGSTGVGAIQKTAELGKWAIGYDMDMFEAVFDGGSEPGAEYLLTSVIKAMDKPVYQTLDDLVNHTTFTSGNVSFGLLENGVALAPYHLAEPSVTQDAKDAVEAARTAIIAGTLDVWNGCLDYRYAPLVRR